jgi:hypothetical protein
MPTTKPDTGTAHTAGPWTAKWSKYREGVVIVQAGMPSNRILAQFDGDGDGPDEQSLADAHLIATAPELLQALKGLLADIEDYQRINNLGGENNHWQVISRAVLAKAEGRS